MKRFRIAWRFTDERWSKLSLEDLSEIKPLRPEKAAELKEHSARYFSAPYELDQRRYADMRTAEALAERAESTREWLRDLNMVPDQTLLISWDQETAVMTKWRIFLTYWDDFCYPASDDIVIWPPSEEWILAYYHFEEFSFGRRLFPPLYGEDSEQ